ncbi:MAG TPA: hypothetical protein VJY33_06300 [Isosphaeraceae bacterium]|nr:hypothetical protein [Isosphaeraceae bacterium]
MATRTWFAVSPLLSGAALVLALLATTARADPITFSTSGTIATSNEPDQSLHGVTGESLNGTLPASPMNEEYPAGLLKLGTVAITAIHPFRPSGPVPAFNDAPFDIKLAFTGGLPTLELKGTMQNQGGVVAALGSVTSVTSSDPSKNGLLPPIFADILGHPESLALNVGMWDWDVTRLNVSASYAPVPEPSSVLVFLGLIVVLGARAQRSQAR